MYSTNKLRILMIGFTQVGKGTYWRFNHSSQILARRGYDVTMMAMSRHSHLSWHERTENGVRMIETPDLLFGSLRSGWDPWDTLRRVAWVRSRDFDLVHAVEARPVVLFPALVAQRRGAKLVMDWADFLGRGGSVEERPNRLVRAVLRPVETYFEDNFRTRADGTIVMSSLLRQRAIELGVPADEILFLPDGADIENLRPIPKTEARRILGWPDGIPIIGYIGAIFKRDAELMADAFDLIRQVQPNAQLLLTGYFNMPIEKMVADPTAIRRTGRIPGDQISLYLSACDVCWLPMCDSIANRGRYPLKVKDYMCVGRPVVITDVGDVADLVRQGRFGLLAEDTPADVAHKVLTLLSQPALGETMGQMGRRLAETECTWEQFTDKLEQFYLRVLRS